MAQFNDFSRSLTAFDPSTTLVVVVEMSEASWLVLGAVPGIERQPLKKIAPDAGVLLALIERWRSEAVRAGRPVGRIVLAYEAGRDGFWLARWLGSRGIEVHVIHSASVAVSRERKRAKTDRLDAAMLMRVLLGWLRGEPDGVMRAMNERDVYMRQSFGGQLRMGRAPALLVVDFQVGFADPEVFGGGNIAPAIAATVPLLAFARQRGWPVAHTRVVYAEDGSDAGIFTVKAPALLKLTEASPLSQVVPQLAPRDGELIVRKQGASAFFGTALSSWLAMRRVDTVVVVGCTTSGCVRASVVDAMLFNYSPVVVTDCVGDRALGPHAANLFDMGQKYAMLMTAAEVMGLY